MRFLSYAKPILRKKTTTVLQSNVDVGSVISAAVSRVLKLEGASGGLSHRTTPPPPASQEEKKKLSPNGADFAVHNQFMIT